MKNDFESESLRSFKDLLKSLQRDREHLRVQVNLAQKELKDEWQDLEEKWETLERSVDEAKNEAEKVMDKAGQELRDAYDRLEARLRDLDR